MADCIVRTERLCLAELTLEDTDLMLAVWNDPAFHRYVGDRGIRTRHQARQALNDGALQLYARYGYGPYRISREDDGVAVGICGLFRRDGLDDPDIGYSVLPEFCRNGYAYEAASAVIEYARGALGLERLTALVAPDNTVSIRLTEKLGLAFEATIVMPGETGEARLYGMQLKA